MTSAHAVSLLRAHLIAIDGAVEGAGPGSWSAACRCRGHRADVRSIFATKRDLLPAVMAGNARATLQWSNLGVIATARAADDSIDTCKVDLAADIDTFADALGDFGEKAFVLDQTARRTIMSLILMIAAAGSKPFGQTSTQFRIDRQRNSR